MDLENEDIEFEQALQDKRHKELKSTLKEIGKAISEKSDNSELLAAVNEQTKAIYSFLECMKNMPNDQKNDIKVETNQDKVVNSVQEMALSILNGLNELKNTLPISNIEKNEPKEWEFKVERNKWSDLIEKVIAKQIIKQ